MALIDVINRKYPAKSKQRRARQTAGEIDKTSDQIESLAAMPVTQSAAPFDSDHWEDSLSIQKLYDHLGSSQGIRPMVDGNDILALYFIGGITKSQQKRRQQAEEALILLMEAKKDLQRLIRDGKIKLKRRTPVDCG